MPHGPPIVILDACTLYPAALRDVLMRLSLHGMIRARWTRAIHNEWIEAVLRDRPDLSSERLQRTRELMDLHAEGCLVTGYEKRIKNLRLPDRDDRHVLAAAIEAKANMILTWNLRDFPNAELTIHGLSAITPDDLLAALLESHRDKLIAILREARLSLKQPPRTATEYLATLRTQGLSRTCALLVSVLSEL
ncbi:MAG: PIN domain-containing protein [Verrucomicrobiales bacterium]